MAAEACAGIDWPLSPLQRFLLGDRVRRAGFEYSGWYVVGVQYAPINTDDVVRYVLAVDMDGSTIDCGMWGDSELLMVDRPDPLYAHEVAVQEGISRIYWDTFARRHEYTTPAESPSKAAQRA